MTQADVVNSLSCGHPCEKALPHCSWQHISKGFEPGQTDQLTVPDSSQALKGRATQGAAVTFSDRAVRKSSMRTQVNTDFPWIMTCVC